MKTGGNLLLLCTAFLVVIQSHMSRATQKTWLHYFFSFLVVVGLAVQRLRYLFLSSFSGAAFFIPRFHCPQYLHVAGVGETLPHTTAYTCKRVTASE